MRRVEAAIIVLLLGNAPLIAQVTAPGIHPVSGRRIANVMGWQ